MGTPHAEEAVGVERTQGFQKYRRWHRECPLKICLPHELYAIMKFCHHQIVVPRLAVSLVSGNLLEIQVSRKCSDGAQYSVFSKALRMILMRTEVFETPT